MEPNDQILIQTAERSKSNSHRLDELEGQNKVLNDLVVSVKLMAQNTEQLTREVAAQGLRLEKLEQQPAERWKMIVKTASSAVITTLIGGVIGALAALLMKG